MDHEKEGTVDFPSAIWVRIVAVTGPVALREELCALKELRLTSHAFKSTVSRVAAMSDRTYANNSKRPLIERTQ